MQDPAIDSAVIGTDKCVAGIGHLLGAQSAVLQASTRALRAAE